MLKLLQKTKPEPVPDRAELVEAVEEVRRADSALNDIRTALARTNDQLATVREKLASATESVAQAMRDRSAGIAASALAGAISDDSETLRRARIAEAELTDTANAIVVAIDELKAREADTQKVATRALQNARTRSRAVIKRELADDLVNEVLALRREAARKSEILDRLSLELTHFDHSEQMRLRSAVICDVITLDEKDGLRNRATALIEELVADPAKKIELAALVET